MVWIASSVLGFLWSYVVKDYTAVVSTLLHTKPILLCIHLRNLFLLLAFSLLLLLLLLLLLSSGHWHSPRTWEIRSSQYVRICVTNRLAGGVISSLVREPDHTGILKLKLVIERYLWGCSIHPHLYNFLSFIIFSFLPFCHIPRDRFWRVFWREFSMYCLSVLYELPI